VIENLLENALLHAPPKTPVSISVEIERQARETEESGESGEKEEAESGESAASNRPAQEWARVTVQNEGPGIPADLLPHLFERYARGQKSLGLGLGLYVSHQIARAHGGTLTADSTPGHGARFTLRLPLATDTPLV
jgi:signal transduction histidine kinase